jgi:hypothetical protein
VVDEERSVAAVDRVAIFELVSASEPPQRLGVVDPVFIAVDHGV